MPLLGHGKTYLAIYLGFFLGFTQYKDLAEIESNVSCIVRFQENKYVLEI